MAYKNSSPELELKLKLSPPRDHRQAASPKGSVCSTEGSPRSSCVSRESSPGAAGPMMLVGCQQCLMYVMLLEDDPKCPKCKSTALIDFLHQDTTSRMLKN